MYVPSTRLSTPPPNSPAPRCIFAGSDREMEIRANQQSKPEREDRINNRGINE